MTRTRLYSNENFPLPVFNALRKLGYDILTIQDESYAGKALSDEEVLNYAIESVGEFETLGYIMDPS